MIYLKQAVVVEGKYDKITLENIIDATIIPLNGFAIFRDAEKRMLLRTLSQREGIIVMTDSDSAGMLIRSHLKNICAGGKIINVYVPQLKGKEKRKKHAGKEGLLGVEGLSPRIITEALERSGVFSQDRPKAQRISKSDMYRAGLSGRENSSILRQKFAQFLGFPQNLSANALLDIINAVFTAEEFGEELRKWQNSEDRK